MLKFHSLRDKVFSLKNLYEAFLHVKANKGRAGLDRVSIAQFEADLDVNIGNIHNKLKTEIYKPSPVLRVYIPKGRNQKRPLGIPTVSDRVVQQATRQIIEPIFESGFSDNSFGFRPGRNCHQAIMRVEQYKSEGYHYVLDADVKAFYDTIPHSLMMDRLREKIADGWVLNSIQSMLKERVLCRMASSSQTKEGTPQGGVLSPLLANLVGDLIDKALKEAGYKFARYADDFIVMTKTAEELPTALSFVRGVVEGKLKMKLSEDKTSLTNFKRGFRFLGYSFMGKYKGISHKSLDKLKDNLRQITRRNQGRNLQMVIQRLNPVIRGHVNYFRLGDVRIAYRSLDQWLRMRLRCLKEARKWRTDNKRFRIRRFYRMGLLSFEDEFRLRRAKA
ncbi:MAG: group II intron reverse transcriptase/maturase [Chlamydiae bacterium]|nr:group II intron reverse transcriptase/maturase [Chlamydiota bacterium]MBI3277205.1 group II intron reverse transcriptase/maturase [Chlamydiota bacterium]